MAGASHVFGLPGQLSAGQNCRLVADFLVEQDYPGRLAGGFYFRAGLPVIFPKCPAQHGFFVKEPLLFKYFGPVGDFLKNLAVLAEIYIHNPAIGGRGKLQRITDYASANFILGQWFRSAAGLSKFGAAGVKRQCKSRCRQNDWNCHVRPKHICFTPDTKDY
ncbi:MAG: hypothetical protein HOO19_03855 [Rhodospirillaceae bacterium]|nr:hypothetical protein [Rhodospirillaceae bacterium]